MNTSRSASKSRPSQATLNQRALFNQQREIARKRNQLKWRIRDAVMTIRNVAWMQNEIEQSDDDWVMVSPHEWAVKRDGEFIATVSSNQSGEYTAIIWQSDGYAHCGDFADGFLAMCWVGQQLRRAVSLNARVDEAMVGEVDPSEAA